MTGEAHVVLRGADLVLVAERAADAPEATYVGTCLLCGEESGLVDYEVTPVAVWSMEHARHQGLDHGQFVVTSQRHWRVGPRVASPPRAEASEACEPPPERAPLLVASLAVFVLCVVYLLVPLSR